MRKLFSGTKNKGILIRFSLLLDSLHLLEVCPSKRWWHSEAASVNQKPWGLQRESVFSSAEAKQNQYAKHSHHNYGYKKRK